MNPFHNRDGLAKGVKKIKSLLTATYWIYFHNSKCLAKRMASLEIILARTTLLDGAWVGYLCLWTLSSASVAK